MPGMEESLHMGLTGAMGDVTDDQVLTGSGVSPSLSGLFNIAANVNAAGTTETFANGVERFAALVDGQYVNGWGDLRVVVGVDTFAKYASLFEANDGAGESLFDYLNGKLAALIVSTRDPAKASNAQQRLVVRTRGSQMMEAPFWNGVQADPQRVHQGRRRPDRRHRVHARRRPAPAVHHHHGGRGPSQDLVSRCLPGSFAVRLARARARSYVLLSYAPT